MHSFSFQNFLKMVKILSDFEKGQILSYNSNIGMLLEGTAEKIKRVNFNVLQNLTT